jgi:hypothetical protein
MLRICMHLLDSALGELWKGCGADAAYSANLDAVRRWSDPLVLEEMSCARRRFDKLEHTFRACFLSFCDDFFSAERERNRIAVRQPPLTAFVHSFLVHASEHRSVRSGHVFTDTTTVTERLACMDCAGEAMFDLAPRFVRLLPSVREEEVPVDASQGDADKEQPRQEEEEARRAKADEADEAGEDDDDPSVSPWDSISNVDAVDAPSSAPGRGEEAPSRRGAPDIVLVGL